MARAVCIHALRSLRCFGVGHSRIRRDRITTSAAFWCLALGFRHTEYVGFAVPSLKRWRLVGCRLVVGVGSFGRRFLCFVPPYSMESGTEDGDHGAQVFAELRFMVSFGPFATYHDVASKTLDLPLNEIERKSAQAIFVGNHNFADTPVAHGGHETQESGTLEVESRIHVSNDAMLGIQAS